MHTEGMKKSLKGRAWRLEFSALLIVGIHRHSTVFGSLPQTEHLAGVGITN